jgi:hypothetical protein
MARVLWYGVATALAAVVWRRSRGMRAWRRRWLARTGVLAVGFTTLPLGRDGEGMLFPMGLYYLAFGRDWLEAAVGATIVIGLVWALLWAGALLVGWAADRAREPTPPVGWVGDGSAANRR